MSCLEEIEVVQRNLKQCNKDSIVALHKLIYEEAGDRNNRKRLRKFQGFDFNINDERYEQKTKYVAENLTDADLTSICVVLGLQYNVENVFEHIISNLQKGNLLKDDNSQEVTDDEEDDEGEEDGAAAVVKTNDATRYDDAVSEQGSVVSKQISIRDVNAVSHNTRPNNHRFTMNFRDIEDSVPTYDGSETLSIEAWLEDFEETAIIMQWDDFQKYVFAKKSLKGLAALFIKSERGITSWDILKNALLKEFEAKVNSAKLHKELCDRKIKKDESYQEYLLKMKELASRGNIEEKALMQYVIDGINDLSANKAILYGASNLKEFKEKLKSYETINEKNSTKPIEKLFQKKNIHANINSNNNNNNKNEIHCYNCGNKGHKSSNCKDKGKGVKCFKCNRFGHLAKQCKDQDGENQQSNVRLVTVEKDDITLKNIKILNKCYIALFDTGSKVNVIKQKIYNGLKQQQLQKSHVILTGFGNKNNQARPIGKVMLKAEIDENEFELEFQVIPNDYMDVDIVIGYPICTQAEITINANGIHVQKLEVIKMMNIEVKADDDVVFDIEKTASADAKETVKNLIANYQPNMRKSTKVNMKIVLSDETPISCRPRRLPFSEIVDAQVDQWLKEGIIECSESEFSSPIVLVSKKDGSKRLCVDYRRINKVVVKDRFPLPLIEDQLDRLQEAIIFSTIDLKNGFFHVEVEEESRKYTSFVTHNGQYQFCKVPFGLTNSPAVFQRHINTIFRELMQKGIALPYVDDVIIPAKNEEQAVANLKEVLNVAQDYGLNINVKKCHFLKKQIEFLGHLIEKQTISPSPTKMEAMMKYPIPVGKIIWQGR